MSQTSVNEIDVHTLVPALRHHKIFDLVNQFAVDNACTPINDHDPKPLFYQLKTEAPQQFSWTYLEKSTEVWRVQIGRQRQTA